MCLPMLSFRVLDIHVNHRQSPLCGRYLADTASICSAKTDLERNLRVTAAP
ncbi:hypothetical protein LEMLEM_LOCUS23767, partial [Lemmus lemmus]